jgi:hypothetical protein
MEKTLIPSAKKKIPRSVHKRKIEYTFIVGRRGTGVNYKHRKHKRTKIILESYVV